MTKFNPYGDNLLIQHLGPILEPNEVNKRLLNLPPIPRNIKSFSTQERLHCLYSLLDFHIPGLEGGRIYQSIDLLLRQSYRYRNPKSPSTWSIVGGEPGIIPNHHAPAMAATIVGNSGTGKTRSILRSLACYPRQVIMHNEFPNIVGPHPQISWLSVEVPSSGKSADLAANLMEELNRVLDRHINDYMPHFEATLAKDRRDGQKMLDEWRQVALYYFLGVLHLDEVQNFFKLATLRQRKTRKNTDTSHELSIVEDKSLKWILSLLNTYQIPVVFSGTLDGIGALTKRLSTTERITTGGYHKLTNFTNPNDEAFKLFFGQLLRYQFVKRPLPDSNEFRQLIIDLSAGIPRIIISLWICTHRVAFERREDSLKLEDFIKASNSYLAPLKPAISALNSGDPVKMARYDDLLPRDDGIWASFWNPSI